MVSGTEYSPTNTYNGTDRGPTYALIQECFIKVHPLVNMQIAPSILSKDLGTYIQSLETDEILRLLSDDHFNVRYAHFSCISSKRTENFE